LLLYLSHRINVFVIAAALIGSIFIGESRGKAERRFDFLGMFLSGAGLFCLVFGFIEGQGYGWLTLKNNLVVIPSFARTDHEIKDNVMTRLLADTGFTSGTWAWML
jgi:hypothetical protein